MLEEGLGLSSVKSRRRDFPLWADDYPNTLKTQVFFYFNN